ncbi:hypothetical protein FACS189472_01900 [Alphaproteobacteria bacterium]|nr:hypothetical protein FACS189472_01900 [Alphaproteobacteria bacterium]
MKASVWSAVLAISLWIVLFCCFVVDIHRTKNEIYATRCDNVAIPTGGRNRITYATQFIKNSQSHLTKNIFISGVYPETTIKDILMGKTVDDNINFILGKHAKNTQENAREINEWIKNNSIKEILIITSDYHMPRSVLELKHLNPEVKILTHAMKTRFNFRFILNCFKEFHKIAYASLKHCFENM